MCVLGSVSGGQWSVPTAQGSATGEVRCCNFPVYVVMEGLVGKWLCASALLLQRLSGCYIRGSVGRTLRYARETPHIEGPRDAGPLLCRRWTRGSGVVVLLYGFAWFSTGMRCSG